MCKMFKFALLLILIWCSTLIQLSVTQTVTWDIATSSPVFGGQIELRCSVTGVACCTSLTRVWNKVVSSITTQIMNNGVTSFPSKYSETVDSPNDQISLFISDLEESDVDIQYICQYGNNDQHILTMNDSYIYRPDETCPMEVDGNNMAGTLSVAKAAPSPSVSASYGGSDWSSYLTVTGPTAITGNVKFYTISASLDRECTCGNDETLTLSVLTGTVTTNVCDQIDFCKCGNCAGMCFMYSLVGETVALIVVVLIMKFALEAVQIKNILIVVGITAVVGLIISLVVAVPIGLTVCPCRCKNGGKDPLFIILGLGATGIAAAVVIAIFKQKGEKPSEGYELNDKDGRGSPRNNVYT